MLIVHLVSVDRIGGGDRQDGFLRCKLADRIAALEAAIEDQALVVPGHAKQPVSHPLLAEIRQYQTLLAQTLARLRLDVVETAARGAVVGNRQRAAALSRWYPNMVHLPREARRSPSPARAVGRPRRPTAPVGAAGRRARGVRAVPAGGAFSDGTRAEGDRQIPVSGRV